MHRRLEPDPPRSTLRAIAIAALVSLASCRGGSGGRDAPEAESGEATDDGATDDESGGDPSDDGDAPGTTSSTTRRLSLVELSHTYQAVLGVVPPTLSTAPPDSLGNTFDRVVNAQTISATHLEAFAASAREAGTLLIADRTLDEVVPECSDDILPPLAMATELLVHGSGLSGGPDWAVVPTRDPNALFLQYATEATVSYAHTFPAAGSYVVGLDMQILDGEGVEMIVNFDGQTVATITDLTPAQVYTTTVVSESGGPGILDYQINGTGNFTLLITALTIEGPDDPGASFTAERQACGEALVDRLAPLAFRRPLAEAERERLRQLVDLADGDYAEAYRMVFEAIFTSPSFLYLIEVGTPVDDEPGTFLLDDYEHAARLSYALCEGPPDATLRAAAAAGELSSEAQVLAQVQRLMDAPCGEATLQRFFGQLLWLDRVTDLDRDAAQFPDFSEDVAAGMLAESQRFLRELVYVEEASLQTLLSADYSWPDPRSAFIYGLSGVADQVRTTLPDDRAGILTHPSVLAATSTFDTTSPVRRGVFVLEQVLCQELPPPPPDLMVTPPPPDPEATTRERWEQHSDDPACSGCHGLIDPIGFTLEEFDAIGQHRTAENGLPVDASGGAPSLGLDAGSLVGGAALARAVAESPEAVSCFARQWLRFTLGRLETEQDAESLAAVEAALAAGSLKQALAALTTTSTFSHRREEAQP
jgi:hypothetical protein